MVSWRLSEFLFLSTYGIITLYTSGEMCNIHTIFKEHTSTFLRKAKICGNHNHKKQKKEKVVKHLLKIYHNIIKKKVIFVLLKI